MGNQETKNFLSVCFLFGVMLTVWGSLWPILDRALFHLDGTVIETKHVYNQKWRGYWRYVYTIRPTAGGNNFEYVNNELPDNLPVGSRIEKEKWKMTCKVDGEIAEDHFDLRLHIILGCIGGSLIMAGLIRIGYYLHYER